MRNVHSIIAHDQYPNQWVWQFSHSVNWLSKTWVSINWFTSTRNKEAKRERTQKKRKWAKFEGFVEWWKFLAFGNTGWWSKDCLNSRKLGQESSTLSFLLSAPIESMNSMIFSFNELLTQHNHCQPRIPTFTPCCLSIGSTKPLNYHHSRQCRCSELSKSNNN